jgi:cellulose synthase/poly-beta-1,6-N-acetylglucosamine synthase-like glycosyltransferase
MEILILIYSILFIFVWWGNAGYFIFLSIFAIFGKTNTVHSEEEYRPTVTILVPLLNEEALIADKVQNLAQLDYPSDLLEIVFLDGGSTDKTIPVLQKKIKEYPQMKLIKTGKRGKILQLNYYLPEVSSDIIFNTDVDSEFDSDIILKIADEYRRDPKAGVVGAYVMPQDCCDEDKYYWDKQNKIRVLESKAFSSSIVIANCYSFKRELIDKFPEDVIADDIYIPFMATIKGYRTIYSSNAHCVELRGPKNIKEMAKHKFRKGNAYITEILRFIYHLPKMNLFWKLIFLSHTFQLLLMPWVLLLLCLLTISLISLGGYQIVLFWGFIFVISLFMGRFLLDFSPTIETGIKLSLAKSIRCYLILFAILLANGMFYPFYRQTSSYTKTK